MMSSRIAPLILLFVLTSAALYRCNSGQGDNGQAISVQAMPAGLQAHTVGVIGRMEPVYVQYTSVPEGTAEGLITVSPKVAGTATLQGTSLSFQPETAWAAGQTYTVAVSVPGEKSKYQFSFSTPERRAEVLTDGIYLPADQPTELVVQGRVVTNDAATTEEIDQMLQASQGGRALDVTVTPGTDERHFSYTVAGPNRGKDPAAVVITYDGDRSGFASTSGELSVAIPADDDFRVESLVPEDKANGTMLVRFSDVLNAKQDFNGLVNISTGSKFTTKVDGNLLRIYPQENNLGEITVNLLDGIQNAAGSRLGRPTSWNVNLGRTAPALRTVGNGAILPHQGQRLFPFEAVGLSAVRLELVEIYPNNVQQYLQDYSLGDAADDWSLRRVGKLVVQEKIELSSLSGAVDGDRWARYAIDLGKYIQGNASAIYQVRLGFGIEDAEAGCGIAAADFGLQPLDATKNEETFTLGFEELNSRMGDYYGIYGYYDDFNWQDEEDPCKPAYYGRSRFVIQNVVSSNLGLIAKRNPDRSTIVIATDLITGKPRSGATVKAYSFQQQELFTGTTNGEGIITMTTEEAPAIVMATLGEDVAYLNLSESDGLSLSRFDISGVSGAGGIKGAFYAERGVWRPGDSVYLHFVLEDREKRLPANYPIEFTLTDAQSRVVERRTVRPAFGKGLYALNFATGSGDGTGNWSATVEAGGQTYRQNLMIETVKPNRLSIDLNLPASGLRPDSRSATLVSKWLYGAPAANLKATVEMNISKRNAEFAKWTGFDFQDPARALDSPEPQRIFDGTLDAAGQAQVQLPATGSAMPGPLFAGLSTKVFEPGGNFSIDNQRVPYDPYLVYAGVRIPTDEWGGKSVSREGETTIQLAAVDTKGEGVSGRKLTVGVYKVDWRYWWQDNNDNVARFNGSQHTEAVSTYTATTGGDGSAKVGIQVSDWGRYLLRVCDGDGHCSGSYFYGGYQQQSDDRESASLVRLKAEKETVSIGEQINLTLPSSAGGSILVSLESGAGTLQQFWVDAAAGQTKISFKADEKMVPTVYANVTMLQPYAQTTNDRPVRLYGVIPIEVTNPATVLQPTLSVKDTWAPLEKATVEVKEAGGKAMTYTLAIVDEGLLGLTRFETPDLHDRFFAKEALSVRTFDLYRYVIGSINGEFGKVLAVGGDGGEISPEDQSANRFEPVVRHLGPFQLAAGKTASHTVTLPNYVGAVRVMVVANAERAYGSADKRVPVVQPLMVLPTLPRVLGPGETVEMPVNVFAMNDKVRNVTVNVSESSGLVSVGSGSKSMSFSAVGDQLAYFPITVGSKAGVAKFSIKGSGNGQNASQEIEIDVRHPNESTTRANTVAIPAGATQTIPYERFGVEGTRTALVELSTLPAMQLDRHLRYLLRYPYGCVEQTVSPAFAQLYLDRVTKLTPAQETSRKTNIAAGLDALRKFQTSNGGMAYWPGNRDAHPWASSYALHFLIEAERAGYSVPFDLKNQLIKFQRKAAGDWQDSDKNFYASSAQLQRDQAYRLYSLALAGKAEVGAMNRLKGKSAQLPSAARYQLAAAYALLGQKNASTELMQGAEPTVASYRELGYTFGSDIRDMAMILEAQLASNDQASAARQVFRLAERIGQRNWLSTQEAAFAFLSIGKMNAAQSSQLTADFTSPTGARTAVGANTGVFQIELPTDAPTASFTLKNTGTGTLYASVITSGVPLPGEETAVNENLVLTVSYTDENGNKVDVSRLRSGTEFIANYTVRNPGSLGMDYRQLALRSLLPSGWEVSNERLDATATGNAASYDYRDIRDDRVYTFFHLGRGQSKNFALRMTATYPGRYYLPSQVSEAMYANDIKSTVKGSWVEVTK
ncbi:MG2 domain-containing protein [Neolewinella lacunae]|uniref:Alpha-2-macroglobulin n=1 Tax=Neolewinella lacunae TaxID=1517758 RepID=A0A923PM76_9BACT|nr:MG2 domain-containing protein [Neolewinella lacunae]MBC6995271.1 hypothetical protein [Neolewinella lacunae]MDN3635560.1 MG2 domain-containing protein [Neolewinella lacunae]